LFLQKLHWFALFDQGIRERVNLGLAEVRMKILNALVQCFSFLAESASTNSCSATARTGGVASTVRRSLGGADLAITHCLNHSPFPGL
jgi:hypothetical protein